MTISKTSNYRIAYLFLLLNILCFVQSSTAQLTSSPYSRYGIGDLSSRTFGQGNGMGGTAIALQNDTVAMFFINTTNPASYSGSRLTTAELGLSYASVTLQSAAVKKTLNNASFGYVSIAFPFKKWCGASFGLIPYSSVGYKVADHQEITNVGSVDFLYEGNGGISQAYFGLGMKPFYGLPRMYVQSDKFTRLRSIRREDKTFKTRREIYDDYMRSRRTLGRKKFFSSLSGGANASYLFGSIDNSRISKFSTGNTFNTSTGTSARVGDIYLDYGLQMAITIDSVRHRNPMYMKRDSLGRVYDSIRRHTYTDLRNNVQILFGATFAAQSEVRARIDSLSYNFYTSSTGYDLVKDTVEFVEGHKGTITLPLSFGFGLGLKKGDRFLIAADFAMQNWSTFQSFNSNQGLKNSMRVSLGMQFVPNSKAVGINNYHKRVHYRIGGKYMQSALELKSTRLVEYGVTLGFGFPVGRNYLLQNFSMVNIGVELGERGTTTNGLIKEQYFKATIGFTINDRWFVKPKFD